MSAPFRFDINGLRAWAVSAVVLFHFGVPGFDGGFIGVDVFFVISGYLMTGIVVRSLEQHKFSLIAFYTARALRIIPALAVLCAVLMALGWFFLLPPDYRQLSSHTAYSLSFLSNIEYFREAGYFDGSSHEKWLLHTWSLSAEWQFYMALPVLLWATWRLAPGRIAQTLAIGAGFVISLAASIIVTRDDPNRAFFLLHTRAWELLAGGLVLLLADRFILSEPTRRWIGRAGLFLIALSIGVFDKHSNWPGVLAIMPVVAAMMVIFANSTLSLTGHRAAQWLGDRSYSLYLWHWPVCVALVYCGLHRAPAAIVIGLALTLVLGHCSYIYVESQTKKLTRTGNRRAVGLLITAAVLGFGPALLVWKNSGVNGRFPVAIELAAAETHNINPRRSSCHAATGVISPACRFGSAVPTQTALLVGDSHASVLVSAVANEASSASADVKLLSYSGCPYLPGMKLRDDFLEKLPAAYQCTAFNDWVEHQIAQAPLNMPIIIAGRYAGLVMGANETEDVDKPIAYFSKPHQTLTPEVIREFSEQIVRTACEVAQTGRDVYLVRPIPEMGVDVPKSASRRLSVGLDGDVFVTNDDYMRRNGWVWAAQDQARMKCGAQLIDPTTYLCRNGRCNGTLEGRPLYFDDDHLSEFGNALIAPAFAPVFSHRDPSLSVQSVSQ